jgi:hypothetical protein
LQVFFQVFQTHVSSVSYAFKHMLQMFHLDVSKTERVSLLGDPPATAGPGLDEASRGGASSLRVGSGGAGDVQTTRVPTWVCETMDLALDKSIYYCIIIRN